MIMTDKYPFFETSSMDPFAAPIDIFKELKRGNIEAAKAKTVIRHLEVSSALGDILLDIGNWLPFASKPYHISAKLEDYVLVPVFTIPSDLPNRNGVGFPLKEMVKFSVESGTQAYKTFKGKPMHLEHANQDPTIAKGVIADVTLRKLTGYGDNKVWKMIELMAVDRTKDPQLANAILTREMNSYSMGALVGGYNCGLCDAAIGECAHIAKKEMRELVFRKHGNDLVYKKVRDFSGFETSAVKIPAYSVAVSDTLILV